MKRAVLLKKVGCIGITGLITVVLLSSAAVVNAEEEKQDERWHFSVIPYVWLPSVSGKLSPALSSGWTGGEVNLSSGNYLDNLRFAGMLDLQAEKGRWSLLVDLMYVDFSDNRRLVETGLNAFVGEAVIGYAVYRTKDIDFNVIGGVRYATVEGKLEPNLLPVKFSKRLDFVDPVVGIRGKFELGKKWYIPYYFDIGGFSVSSDWTSQGFAGIGYHFSDLFSMVLGYRYLYYDFGDKFVKSMTLNGVALGFVFSF